MHFLYPVFTFLCLIFQIAFAGFDSLYGNRQPMVGFIITVNDLYTYSLGLRVLDFLMNPTFKKGLLRGHICSHESFVPSDAISYYPTYVCSSNPNALNI